MVYIFDPLRVSDLKFQYVANNWLLGKKPPSFGRLMWNKDSTQMPADPQQWKDDAELHEGTWWRTGPTGLPCRAGR